MSADNNRTNNRNTTTHDAGLSSPHPSEAHRRAGVKHQMPGVKGQKRTTYNNGSKLDMEHDGEQWWIVKVTPAPWSFKRSNEN